MRTIIDQGYCLILLVELMVYDGIIGFGRVTSLWVRVGFILFVMVLWVLSVSPVVVDDYDYDYDCYYVFV